MGENRGRSDDETGENRELGEVNFMEKEEKYQPGIMLIEKEEEALEVYYLDSFGNYWTNCPTESWTRRKW